MYMVLYLYTHSCARRGHQIPLQTALGCYVGIELRTYVRATNALYR